MIYINTDPKHPVFAGTGDIVDIATDLHFAIGKIHAAIKKKSPQDADMFRHLMEAGMTAKESPVWSCQDEPGQISVVFTTPKGGDS